MALAFKMRGEPRVAMTFFGEGSTANGQWHEAMNFAGVHRLPVVFVLENNRFAYSTPNELEFAVDPVRAREGLRVPGRERRRQRRRGGLRGRPGRRRARPGGRGPDADRVPDDAHARPRRPRRHELRARTGCSRSGRGATRSSATRERLADEHGFEAREIEEIRASVKAYVDECARTGARLADARPRDRDRGVFAESWEPLGDGQAPWSRWSAPETGSRPDGNGRSSAERPSRQPGRAREGRLMAEMTYLQAISDGLREEMRRDETVFCLGEDIGAFGGAFKVTDGFIEEFGADRVLDTPLAENAIIGAADRRRDRGHEAGLRDAVRRLHLLRLRPARQRRRQAALPPGGRRCRWWSGCRPAAASRAGRSTRRTPRPGSCRRRG